jgi:hypothetical protein
VVGGGHGQGLKVGLSSVGDTGRDIEHLYRVLAKAGYDDVNKAAIARINRYCHLCQLYSKAPDRFRFMIRDDAEFNYRLIVDVIYIINRPVLHAVDEATASQATRFIPNLQVTTI